MLVSRYLFTYCHILVGGLAEEVDKELLRAAFIPFGDIIDINMPLDYQTGMLIIFSRKLTLLP